MNYELLKTEAAAYVGFDDQQIADSLNSLSVEAIQNIQVADINQYLIVTGKILAIEDSALPVARLTVKALAMFDQFVMTNPANVYALNAQLDGLIDALIIDENDTNYILSLGVTTISRATQLGLGKVTAGDVEYARGLN